MRNLPAELALTLWLFVEVSEACSGDIIIIIEALINKLLLTG